MEGEIMSFVMVWALIYLCVCYCYVVARITPQGKTRLVTFLPVVCLFLVLPLNPNLHSFHLRGLTSLFISWLANFKLLLLAFGLGPLGDPSLSLARFFALTCLPINVQQKPSGRRFQNHPSIKSPSRRAHSTGLGSPLDYAAKALILALWVHVYDYRVYLHPSVVRVLHCIHMYINLELLLATAAAVARALLGLKLEPQFNHPYLATSLQNFWGRRWNLAVSSVLHSSVYLPIHGLAAPILGQEWASVAATMGTFSVSGVMHDLFFYHTGRSKPTWGNALFFLIHGLCVCVEIATRKKKSKYVDRFRLHPIIKTLLTLGFLMTTLSRLLLPALLQFGAFDMLMDDYAALGMFRKRLIGL